MSNALHHTFRLIWVFERNISDNNHKGQLLNERHLRDLRELHSLIPSDYFFQIDFTNQYKRRRYPRITSAAQIIIQMQSFQPYDNRVSERTIIITFVKFDGPNGMIILWKKSGRNNLHEALVNDAGRDLFRSMFISRNESCYSLWGKRKDRQQIFQCKLMRPWEYGKKHRYK